MKKKISVQYHGLTLKSFSIKVAIITVHLMQYILSAHAAEK